MAGNDGSTPRERWARLRFSVVAPLLAAPPERGDLRLELERLATKTWRHPVTGDRVAFSFSTVERWYYRALATGHDPMGALARKLREDAGKQPSMGEKLRAVLRGQWQAHKGWSYQLHYDNLGALAEGEEKLRPLPSYATVRRYMRRSGLVRRRGVRAPRDTAGAQLAEARLEEREVRSYEAEYVSGLWHLDFHDARRSVLTRDGHWVKPVLLGVLDDHSRLACHVQWYFEESAENLAHGLSQAIQKRGLPRALMTDRGGAMLAAETQNGLEAFGVTHETTLPYSPYQNAKQEVFWGLVEGRLMPMLERVKDLGLDFLQEATQALVELEYHREVHSEIGTTPLRRFLDGKSVARPSPTSAELRRAFAVREDRTVRRSDGTIPVEGRRYEVPSRYRHMEKVRVSFARWDLGTVDLIDRDTRKVLATLTPVDKTKNADGRRRQLEALATDGPEVEAVAPAPGIAPLLAKLMKEYRATGLPPAYLPKEGSP